MNKQDASRPHRPAACAGRFYPAAPQDLRTQINAALHGACCASGPAPKAVIAPHAGYVYSGPVAGSAFARWERAGDGVQRIVVLGPSHYVALSGMAVSSADGFETPLGRVPLDTGGIATLLSLPQVRVHEEAHRPEHCIELELPFLQVLFDRFVLVPLLVGSATDQEVDEVLELLWDQPGTRVVVSSDLSHFHEYAKALAMDAETARAIENLQAEMITSDRACGSIAMRGLLRLARRRAMTVTTVDLRNSGDTAGSRDRVVGYGAFLFAEAQQRA
jgi:MEMO1 family protein